MELQRIHLDTFVYLKYTMIKQQMQTHINGEYENYSLWNACGLIPQRDTKHTWDVRFNE